MSESTLKTLTACAAREVLTADEINALRSMLKYAESEHGKSQGGYFSGGGWAGYTLTKLLERATHAQKAGESR